MLIWGFPLGVSSGVVSEGERKTRSDSQSEVDDFKVHRAEDSVMSATVPVQGQDLLQHEPLATA